VEGFIEDIKISPPGSQLKFKGSWYTLSGPPFNEDLFMSGFFGLMQGFQQVFDQITKKMPSLSARGLKHIFDYEKK